jgi:hypothetical protein
MRKNLKRFRGLVAIPLVFGIGGAALGGAIAGTLGASIGFMAGSMLGSYLFPMKVGGGGPPKISNYPIQTSSKGNCVRVIYGRRKTAGNIVWMSEAVPYQRKV